MKVRRLLICSLAFSAIVVAGVFAPMTPSRAENTPANSPPTSAPKASPAKSTGAAHPLDPALKIAREKLEYIKKNVRDYTCTIIKRERVGDQLGESQFIFAKIRHQQEVDGKVTVPFSVYLKFLKPKDVEGREVIYVAGRNDDKLVAHESGLLNFKRVWLPPRGFIAMRGQRYPIMEIGMQNLAEQLVKRGERDRQHGEIEVKFFENAKVNGRPCYLIQVLHPEKRSYFDFYKAQIFIDNETNMPIRYAAWAWPEKPGGEPLLLEEYTYIDVKLNVGLTDKDFDPDNEAYNFPSL